MSGTDTAPSRRTSPDSPYGHAGELALRAHFPSRYDWDEVKLARMILPVITPGFARFIAAAPFFFIATANDEGHCDASFRGRESDMDGSPLPALCVEDERHLLFPDFSGNGLYNSLGNILTNPHIGMLFMDFERQLRARVNGRAEIVEADSTIRTLWPPAQAAVRVTVEQVYGNCSARIPKMAFVQPG